MKGALVESFKDQKKRGSRIWYKTGCGWARRKRTRQDRADFKAVVAELLG